MKQSVPIGDVTGALEPPPGIGPEAQILPAAVLGGREALAPEPGVHRHNLLIFRPTLARPNFLLASIDPTLTDRQNNKKTRRSAAGLRPFSGTRDRMRWDLGGRHPDQPSRPC